MYPYIHFVIPSYAFMVFIGAVFVVLFLFFRIERYQVLFSDFLKYLLISIVGCLIGSKLLFAITRLPWLIQNFSIYNLLFLIPTSGYVFYGGLFGVIFALYFFTRKDPLKRRKIIDFATPALPLFHVFGRIGCFFAGCCYGMTLDSSIELWDGIIINRVPVQLIESVVELILFFMLILVERKREKYDLLEIYLLSYGIYRFFIEFVRDDEVRGNVLGISTSQWISMMIVIYYIFCKHFLKSHFMNDKKGEETV